MSPRCEWLVLCSRVLQDAQTQNLTIVDCLERVSARSFPALHPSFAFAARYEWTGDPPDEDVKCTFRFLRGSRNRDPEELAQLEGVWRAGTRRTRVFASFAMLRLFGPEDVWFRLDHRLDAGTWSEGQTAWLEVRGAE